MMTADWDGAAFADRLQTRAGHVRIMMMVYWNGVALTSAFNHGLDDRLSVSMHTAKALYRICTPTYGELMIDDSLIHSSAMPYHPLSSQEGRYYPT